MAASNEKLLQTISKVSRDLNITLKKEQQDAIKSLFYRRDLLAVLPTGFGKSMIFQMLVKVSSKVLQKNAKNIVVCPLKSIVSDQVLEAESMGIRAGAINTQQLQDVFDFDIVFASAEEVLTKDFLDFLKREEEFRKSVISIVIDESHTIETWTSDSRHKKKKNSKKGFREDFARLGKLRSFCESGTPVAAVTGTADKKTQDIIKASLLLLDPLEIYLSPNRENLKVHVNKVPKQEQFKHLDWIISSIILHGEETPKTIIFCNTMNEIASVVNYLFCKLDYENIDKRVIGIYHSNSWSTTKEKIMKSFKGNGCIRVVVASTALCMGVNFPDVRFIVNWGPARSIVDQIQQAGRAGRDGARAHVIITYHGQQAGPCNKDVKEFIKSTTCLRVALYRTLDSKICPSVPLHNCCSVCARNCDCSQEDCNLEEPFQRSNESNNSHIGSISGRVREVSDNDKSDIEAAIKELVAEMNPQIASCFSSELIEDIVDNCEYIFTLDDIISKFPVFSVYHALKVLEVIQEVFLDIPYLEETLSCLDISNTSFSSIDYRRILDTSEHDNMEELLDNFEV